MSLNYSTPYALFQVFFLTLSNYNICYNDIDTNDDNTGNNNIKTITTLEIAEMMGVEHYKIPEKLEGTKVSGCVPEPPNNLCFSMVLYPSCVPNAYMREIEAAETKGDFSATDTMLNNECGKRLQPYKKRLQGTDYEQIRDVVYSISYLSKQAAFEAGFRTAAKLIMECMQHDRTT